MSDNKISYSNVKELILKQYPPLFFTTFSSALSGFFNGLITGHFLSATEMVALSLITPLTMVVSALSSIFCTGASISVGHHMGRGEGDKINNVFSTAIVCLIVVSGLLTITCYTFAPQLAVIFGATEQTAQYTISYIKGISLGLIPTMLVPCFMTFLQMCNKSKVSLIFTLLLAGFVVSFGLINVTIINYGIYGMGLATSLSQYIVMFISIIYFLIKKNIVKFEIYSFDINECLTIIKLGTPSSIAGILYAIRNIFMNSVCLEIGGIVAANALAIISSLSGFIDSFNIAMTRTTTMIVSVFVGEKDTNSIKRYALACTVISLIIAFAKVAVYLVFGNSIIAFFGGEGEVVSIAKSLLLWVGAAHCLNMIQLIVNSTYACEGRTVLCTVNIFLNAIVAPFICLCVAQFAGVIAIWVIYLMGEIASLIFFYCVACVKKKAPVNNLDDILYLHEGFENDGIYSITINKIEDVTNIAINLQTFCQQHGIDDRRSKLIGLCSEELAANIIENEFEKDRKENTIDIFACIVGNEVSLRLRDNCVPFDPHSKLGMEGKDITEDIGIKLVAKIAKEMNYQVTFDMNILTIKL